LSRELEIAACTPVPLNPSGFNAAADLPYGVNTTHVRRAMEDFLDFLRFINSQLNTKRIERLESFLMPANFSSIVGEFMGAAIPKYCESVVRNKYHNGHPDIIPKGLYPEDAILHGTEGIEVKGSRHVSGWQGHNPEDVWLLVFVFDSNTSRDMGRGIEARPFKFIKVVGARLGREDWAFSGRSATSRRTITASVTRTGYAKMEANWLYRAKLE
jgi:hypothetical protein